MYLWLHITCGAIGLGCGWVAVSAKKGSNIHARAGQAFAASMSLMALSGAWLAVRDADVQSIVAGLFSFYLVVTAWLAVRPPRKSSRATLLSCAALASMLVLGTGLAAFLSLQVGDVGEGVFFGLLATLSALAGAGDLRLARHGPEVGRARLLRHLWRMLLALLIASAAFFLGQADEFPLALRERPLLLAMPVFAALAVIPYWLWRMRRRVWVRPA